MKKIGKRVARGILSEMSEGDLRLLLETASSLVGQKNNRLINFADITISSGDFPPSLVQEMTRTLAEHQDATPLVAYTVFDVLGVKVNVVRPDGAASIAACIEMKRPWQAQLEGHYKVVPSEYIVDGMTVIPRWRGVKHAMLVNENVARALIRLGAKSAAE